ncbi:MAG TPA: hypothetical protein VGR28_13265 [Candidatus Thermoplasmatota archaeon]|jgi:DNA-binding Lrp family transcriptional regulator|nr:hypothetical protein [Candidatus Thermoplasmatota archaeon]
MASAPFALDELDFRILREMFEGQRDFLRPDRVALDEVARSLGVHRNTVSTRVRRLEEQRIYLPMSVAINDPTVGLVGGFAWLPVPAAQRSEATLGALMRVEGLSNVFLHLDGWHALLHAPDAATLAARLDEAARICRVGEVSMDLDFAHDFPPAPPAKLSALEARLLPWLYRDGRAPFAVVAAELGASARTVEHTYRRLRDRGVLFQTPGQVRGYPGMAAAYLKATFAPGAAEARGELLKAVPEHFVRMPSQAAQHLYVYARSVAELEAMAERARTVPGIAAVRLHVLTRKCANPRFVDWLAEHLTRRAAV